MEKEKCHMCDSDSKCMTHLEEGTYSLGNAVRDLTVMGGTTLTKSGARKILERLLESERLSFKMDGLEQKILTVLQENTDNDNGRLMGYDVTARLIAQAVLESVDPK